MTSDDSKKEFIPPFARAQLVVELVAFILCVIVTGGQLGLLDWYFVLYGDDNLWLIWIIGDFIVIAVMCWLFSFAIRYTRRCLKGPCKDEANLKYAFVVWLVYSVVLSAKIAVFFPKFAKYLLPDDTEAVDKRAVWGPIALKFILAMSAVIFLLLVVSHHYNRFNNPRALYLSYLSSVISVDLLDSVLFLELLVEPTLIHHITGNDPLKIVILIFACINFILPTLSLFKLRYTKGLPRWVPLPYEKLYSLFYFLFVNVPYLVIRSYLWRQREHDVSIFLVKNVIMVAVGLRDVWVSFLLWKEKRAIRALEQSGGTLHGGRGNQDQDAASDDRLQA